MQTEHHGATNSGRIDFSRPHRFLDVGHARLAYWRVGTGPDLVFLHGWPLSAATFRGVLPHLAEAFTCHLFDLPGAGLSEWTDGARVELREHVATARAAIDSLGLDRCAIVAHDSGGFVARHVAAADSRVSALVLGNTEIPGHTPPLLVAYSLLARFGGPRLLRRMLATPALRTSALGFAGCFRDPRYTEGEFGDLFVKPLLRSDRALDGAYLLLRNAGADTMKGIEAVHARIEAPVLLLWGTDDPWFPLRKARPMLSQFGGRAELVEIPGGKLFAHEDHAAVFAARARAFLESARAPS